MMLDIVSMIMAIYYGYIIWILIGWSNTSWLTRFDVDNTVSDLFVSIIIPVRDEAHNISRTIHSILANDFPSSRYEILILDDHSCDNLGEVLAPMLSKNQHLKIIRLDENESGKKKAVEKGVKEAQGDIILCTDGDCQVPKGWLGTYEQFFFNFPNTQMAFGPVKYLKSGFWHQLLNLELAVLVLSGASTIMHGIPTMINGANMAFRKKAFMSVDGYSGNSAIPSGDDEFLLRKVYRAFPNGIKFLKTKGVIVETSAANTSWEFLNQRKRWAAKWRFHTDIYSRIIPVIIFFSNFSVLILFGSLILHNHLQHSLMLLLTKAILDFIIVYISAGFLNIRVYIHHFIFMEIIYPIYVVFFGLASNFGQYAWKKRIYNN